MTVSFLPSLLVPIIGLLVPFFSICFFLIFVDKETIV